MMSILTRGTHNEDHKGIIMVTKRRKTKSPLKTKPLRLAGQSLSEELDDVVYYKILFWMMLIILFGIMALLEWIRWWQQAPPNPIVVSILSAVGCGVAVWKIWRLFPYARNLNLGRQGEILVSQCLDQLKADGYRVFDDVVGDGFNVDHVLVGPGGIFAIETKTRRKPEGDARVVYDGKKLTVDGHTPDRDPIQQVINESRHIRDILKLEVSDIDVKPVLIYPGWYTEQPHSSDVWVLNETAFPKWIKKEPPTLSADKVSQISGIIATHVRGRAD